MTRIKFCGIKENTDIDVINELKPDLIGFVFWERSKRLVSAGEASYIGEKLDPGIEKVGVFVDEDMQRVAELLNKGIIDTAQLHGNEDEDYISGLRKLSKGKIIKAFRIKEKEDLDKAFKSSADLILLDAGMGEGKIFEWELLEGFGRDYILAGGLDASNVRQAIERLHPYGVDVSSGIETDGIKDPDKMRAFEIEVRNK